MARRPVHLRTPRQQEKSRRYRAESHQYILRATRTQDDIDRLLHKPDVDYSQGLAEKICAMVAIGMSFPSIAAQPGMPSVASMMNWSNTNEQFHAMYSGAAASRAEYWAEEMLRISDWVLQAEQIIDPRTGRTMIDPGLVQAAKMKCENLRWLLCKLYPLKYGDGLTLRHAGHDGGPLTLPRTFNLDSMADEQLHQLALIVTAALPAPEAAAADDPEAGGPGEG